jgi:hypothetical protein
VKVKPPFRVVHEGVANSDGDVVEVPDNDTTNTWITARWVESVSAAQKGKA